MTKNRISPRVIERLTKYLRCLANLESDDFISSEGLAKKMGYTAAQVRKDLSNFGEFGIRGKGYQIKSLFEDIENILGINKINKIILIGVGRLGEALLSEPEFTNKNFNLVGVFEKSKEKIGNEIQGLKIKDIDTITDFLGENKDVEIAIITVPKIVAQELANTLVGLGIRAILNFAPMKLDLPKEISVENIDLYAKLQVLNYWKESSKLK